MSAYTAPQATAEALPPLVTTICQVCGGTGGDEDYEGMPIICEYCNGRGCTEVCEGCGLKVDAFTDSCGCNTLCELCSAAPVEVDGICRACYLTGLEAIREDAPPHIIAQELAFARAAGWLA